MFGNIISTGVWTLDTKFYPMLTISIANRDSNRPPPDSLAAGNACSISLEQATKNAIKDNARNALPCPNLKCKVINPLQ